MRILPLLSTAAVAAAWVVPDQATLESLVIEDQDIDQPSEHPFWDKVHEAENFWEDLEEKFAQAAVGCAKHRFEEVTDSIYGSAVRYGEDFTDAFAGEDWLGTADHDTDLFEKPPHHGPPHHGPPHHGPPGKRPGKGPGHPHHPHHPRNETIWELISKSKYTTKLAAALGDFPDLVEKLNGTKANYTLFAPTDHAFEKIPKHAPKPPKEFLEKILTYHVSPEFYPAPRIFLSRTIPTALEAKFIGKVPQRLSTQVGLRGLTVNFYSRIVAVDILASNGVIHGIDSILLPPPKGVDILSALPGEFSTLTLALEKTGLYPDFNNTSYHKGGTLFAPSNFAFKRLGPRINAFLFSRFGLKYLKALILYHAGDNITLYSDAIYKAESDAESRPPHKVPKSLIHVDLPTGLEGKSLSIDIARYGRLITMKINAFTRVVVLDGIAADGVIHVVPNVLIPPKTPGALGVAEDNMDLDEFKARLAPFVEADEDEWAEENFEL